MAKKKIYRTVIRFEVLSEEPNVTDGMTLDMLYEATMTGDLSGQHLDPEIQDQVLAGKEAVKAIEEQGSDPEFFGLDQEGNDIYE
jgi:hypothetical protein